MPKLYIISGCNGVGKTTASYTILPKMLACNRFLTSDEFAKSISPFDQENAQFSAGRLMLMSIKLLFKKQESFSIETTLATKYLINIIKQARELGYDITLIYMWVNSPAIALERVKQRVIAGGHNIPEDIINRRYYKGIENLFKRYMDLCDKWIIADNSIIPFTLVAEGTNPRPEEINMSKTLQVYDAKKFQAIQDIAENTITREKKI